MTHFPRMAEHHSGFDQSTLPSIPLTARQSALILTFLDFHDGEFNDEREDAPFSVEALDEVTMLREHLAKMP